MNSILPLIKMAGAIWRPLAGAALFGFLAVAAGVGMLATAAYLVAAAAFHPPLAALSTAIAGVRLFTLLRAGARYLERYLGHAAALKLLSHLRVKLYAGLEAAAPLRQAGIGEADLFARLVADIDTIQYFYLRLVLPPLVAVAALAALAVFLGLFAGRLVLPATVGFLLVGLLLPLAAYRQYSRLGRQLVNARAGLNTALLDHLQGWRELSAGDRLGAHAVKVTMADGILAAAQRHAAGLTGLSEAAGGLIGSLTWLAVFLVAAGLVRDGSIPGVWLGAIALAVQGAAESVLPLSASVKTLGESCAAAERVFPLVAAWPAGREPAEPAPEPADFAFELRDVRFRYRPDGPWVIDGLSFSLPAGHRVAVVGPSGAGKSTLGGLLLKLWDYEGGSITLGGREIGEYPASTLQSLAGVLEQQPFIFNATVADNIRLARPGAGEDAIAAAAVAAGLGEALGRWPQGLNTAVGANGHALSGGERQRLAIARVLLKAPALVILDEPTANLDPLTEQAVMDNILAATAGRTTLLITHRLSGLAAMDDIVVIDGGKVAEHGRMDELLARRGQFYAMWRLEQELF